MTGRPRLRWPGGGEAVFRQWARPKSPRGNRDQEHRQEGKRPSGAMVPPASWSGGFTSPTTSSRAIRRCSQIAPPGEPPGPLKREIAVGGPSHHGPPDDRPERRTAGAGVDVVPGNHHRGAGRLDAHHSFYEQSLTLAGIGHRDQVADPRLSCRNDHQSVTGQQRRSHAQPVNDNPPRSEDQPRYR